MLLTLKLRLRDKHAAELNRQARAANVVWNYCNETQQKAVRSGRRWLSKYDLQKLTAGAGKELDLHAHTIQQVCHQYVRSRYRRATLHVSGYRDLAPDMLCSSQTGFGPSYADGRQGRSVSTGTVPEVRGHHAKLASRWGANVRSREPCHSWRGGTKDLATTSDGSKIDAPRFYRKSEETLATAQRAKKTKRVRAIHRKVANRRKDFLHKASANLAKAHDIIIVGDVSSSKLSRTNMAKSVQDAGWHSFKQMLSYKAMRHGGRMLEVSERYTTQTCSSCGELPPERPKGITGLGIRQWCCSACGVTHDRDVNAARNIARLGLETLAGGTRHG